MTTTTIVVAAVVVAVIVVAVAAYSLARIAATEDQHTRDLAEQLNLDDAMHDCGNWTPEEQAHIERAIANTLHAIDLELWAQEMSRKDDGR